MNGEIKTHPTKIDNESFDWMVGKSIDAAEFAEPGSWWFSFSGGGQCSTHGGMWRLADADAMIVSSKDHGHQFGLPAPLDASSIVMSWTQDALVQSVEIRKGAPDLLIRFDDGLLLEILASSWGYECWEARNPEGRCVVTHGNRSASWWSEVDEA